LKRSFLEKSIFLVKFLLRKRKANMDKIYEKRFLPRIDELKWLYMELYDNGAMLNELTNKMEEFYKERSTSLKKIDYEREKDPDWYKSNKMSGMQLYIDNFSGDLKGLKGKIDYIKKCHVNYVHLMPFLDTPEGRSDGGYAVSDFRKVRPDLGTVDDLRSVAEACHKEGISLCMDYVMNHTSEDHEWAKRARAGEGEYMTRYFFYDNDSIPEQYDATVPQVFPTTAPGNFTWLPDINHFVMTQFYPYQWDLNYRNPRVFNEMMYNFLFLANCGIDIMRLDAVPYIWKQLGTRCRNLPQVHTLVRMMRIISEIVCPGVILLGEVVMEPVQVVPYFGTPEKPECHMLYNVTTMATTWNCVAMRDIRLLRKQLDIVNALPKQYVFLNYLRCHDDIGWGLDYDTLALEGMEERPHKDFINRFFLGETAGSRSRGELYNADPVTGDARFCGTTASMCGIEKALYEKNDEELELSIDEDLMLHAYLFMQSGIPVIYSGDEIGQVNDYSYKDDPARAEDSRYVHRGKFNWDAAERISKEGTVEERIFDGIDKLVSLRQSHKAFYQAADSWTIDTGSNAVLGIGRYFAKEQASGFFNFSDRPVAVTFRDDNDYKDLLAGGIVRPSDDGVIRYELKPYGYSILLHES
jgi:amylosucrase